jgi:hypothetical protein
MRIISAFSQFEETTTQVKVGYNMNIVLNAVAF